MLDEEAWSAMRGGDAAHAAIPREQAGVQQRDDTSADAGGAPEDAAAADAATRASTKRQRMEQLIQKSMDMIPQTFEQEALPPTDSHHTSSSAAAPTLFVRAGISSNASSKRRAVAAARTGGGNGDDIRDDASEQRAAPHSSKQSWTRNEDVKLCALVQQHGVSQWAQVAAHFPNRDRKRCRERFVNHLDPQLRQQQWTADEDAQLMRLQKELGAHWAQIARKLPGRSPEDAKNRFLARAAKAQLGLSQQPAGAESEQRVMTTRAPPKRWSKNEADALRSLVQTHGATNWFFLASHLPGRTDLQCMQQWFQVLDPAIVKGKGSWTAVEDATLASKVQELGRMWTQISRFLPGRVGKQCRERYLNHLDPSLCKDPWTPEEEEKLTRACETHATQWSEIAKELPGRSENAIKNHWYTLARRKLVRASTSNS